jgi:NAD(P)H-dependent flavin oxidoreductase YrpB (nitropropane dioxygenase family)
MFNAAGRQEYIGPFAGQVCGLIGEIKPAAEIVKEMIEQAVDILGRKLAEEVQLA